MKYCGFRIDTIRSWYIFVCVLWITLLSGLGIVRFFPNTILTWLALFPLIVFTIAFASAPDLDTETEQQLMRYNTLTLGLVIVLPLMTWIADRIPGNGHGIRKKQYIAILVSALVLAMLALVDVWVPQRWLSLETHIRSSLQTMSLALLVIALYLFYIYHPHDEAAPLSAAAKEN